MTADATDRRRRTIAVVTAVAVASAATGWIAGQRIQSPAERAAAAEPPVASLVTVPVESAVLSTSVILRGQVEFDEETDLPSPPSPEGATIVTGVAAAAGDELTEGDVPVEISGRPLLVLEGELPVFRTIGPGVEGPDVRQLEQALVRRGFDPGVVDETYDAATERAVEDLYRAAGYAPRGPGADDLDALDGARQRVQSATESVRSAREAADTAVPASTRLSLDQAIRQAQDALDDARRDRDRETQPVRTAAEEAAAALVAAQAEQSTAATRLDAARSGRHPDHGGAPTEAELAELERAAADAERAVATATTARDESNVALATVDREWSRVVRDAETNLAIAEASRREALAGGGAGAGGLAAAQRELSDAEDALARLDASIGTFVPPNELVFLPALPRVVQRVHVALGDEPAGPSMTVTGSGVVIRSSVSTADRPFVTEGAVGTMDDAALGIAVPVEVEFVAATPGGPQVGDDRFAIRLTALGDLPDDAVGRNLRVTLPFESTDGEVLAVPPAALSAGADGSARVQVERADGSVELVTVRTGLLARGQGLVEIEPLDGDLRAGDRVVVGRAGPGDPADGDGSEDDGAGEGDGDG